MKRLRLCTLNLPLFAAIVFTAPVLANADCSTIKNKLNTIERQKRAGGTAQRMQQLQKRARIAEEDYFRCIRNNEGQGSIFTASGNNNESSRRASTPRLDARSQDSTVQTRINTCNYWTETYNAKATRDNHAQMTSACRAAKKALEDEEFGEAAVETFTPVRSLRECHNANGVLDNRVVACMKGETK